MTPRRARTAILTGLALVATGAIAAPPQSSLPPFSWAYQPVGVEERGLWMEADEFERQLRDSPLLVRDEALQKFVLAVLCRTVGEDRCRGVRLYILRDPSFNASMMANGLMQVNTGSFLRLRSEAELAAVLAHEFAHFELRHPLASYNRQRSTADKLMLTALTDPGARISQFAILGSFYQFQRSDEIEADYRSFDYLAASSYRAAASAEIWQRMAEESDAAAAREPKKKRVRFSWTDTHPRGEERMRYLVARAAERGNRGEDGVESYAKALAGWWPQFLADQVRRNDFDGSEFILGQLARSGWTADLLVARGDLYRQRGNPRDLIVAAQAYRDAIAQGARDPVVRRDLGTVLLRSGARSDAAAALRQYLALRPDAPDKAMIAMLIDQAAPTMTPVLISEQVSTQGTVPATGGPSGSAAAKAGAIIVAPVRGGKTEGDTQ